MKILFAALAATVLTAAIPAAAQPRGAITNPDWAERPSAEDVETFYPKLANLLGLDGYAIISCTVNVLGELEGCRSGSETPKDLGFGAAAVAMSGKFKMRPKELNGIPVDGGTVRIPIRFKMQQPERASEPPKPSAASMSLALQLVDAIGVLDATIAKFEGSIDEASEPTVPIKARTVAADALKAAIQTHKGSLREAFARVFTSLFSDAEMSAMVTFERGASKAVKGDPAVAEEQVKVVMNTPRALREAAQTAFCAKYDCGSPAAFARTWRLEGLHDDRIDNPQWARSPSESTVRRAGPALALTMGVSGAVRLTCRVTVNGSVEACAVDEDAPRGMGFGAAALELAGRYRLSPIQLAAGAVGRKVTLRLEFPPEELPKAYVPPVLPSERQMALARQFLATSFDADEVKRAVEIGIVGFRSKIPSGADRKLYDAMIDAYRISATQAAETTLELSARALASTIGSEQLETIAAFQASAAGKAQRERAEALDAAAEAALKLVSDSISADARAAFCKVNDCTAPPPPLQTVTPASLVTPSVSTTPQR